MTPRRIVTAAIMACALAVAWIAISLGDARNPSQPTTQPTTFLFSYFVGNGEDGLHLAHSSDGYTFKPLNGGKSFLTPTVGESKLMRDPCIVRGPNSRAASSFIVRVASNFPLLPGPCKTGHGNCQRSKISREGE